MSELLDFIKENWRLLLEALMVLISFILALTRKKPVKVQESYKETILRILPKYIVLAEEKYADYDGDDKGIQKKNYVICKVEAFLIDSLGLDEDIVDGLTQFIINALENILSTPTKKGK